MAPNPLAACDDSNSTVSLIEWASLCIHAKGVTDPPGKYAATPWQAKRASRQFRCNCPSALLTQVHQTPSAAAVLPLQGCCCPAASGGSWRVSLQRGWCQPREPHLPLEVLKPGKPNHQPQPPTTNRYHEQCNATIGCWYSPAVPLALPERFSGFNGVRATDLWRGSCMAHSPRCRFQGGPQSPLALPKQCRGLGVVFAKEAWQRHCCKCECRFLTRALSAASAAQAAQGS